MNNQNDAPQQSNKDKMLNETLAKTNDLIEKIRGISTQNIGEEEANNQYKEVQNEVQQLTSDIDKTSGIAPLSLTQSQYKFGDSNILIQTITAIGTIRVGVDMSDVYLKQVDSRLEGTLVQSIKNGIISENELGAGTDIWIYVNDRFIIEPDRRINIVSNNNYWGEFRFDLTTAINSGQAVIMGTIKKNNGTTIEFGKNYTKHTNGNGNEYYLQQYNPYIFSPIIDAETGDAVFTTQGLSFAIPKEEYEDILYKNPYNINEYKNSDYYYYYYNDIYGKWLHISIPDSSNTLTANGTISAGGTVGYNYDNAPIQNLRITGADNLIGFMFYVATKSFSGQGLGAYQLQVKYALADGTTINDVIDSPDEIIRSYKGTGNVRAYFDVVRQGNLEIKFETVQQLINAGGKKKHKIYRI